MNEKSWHLKVQTGEGRWQTMPLADNQMVTVEKALIHLKQPSYAYYEVYEAEKGPSKVPPAAPVRELHRPLETTKPAWSS